MTTSSPTLIDNEASRQDGIYPIAENEAFQIYHTTYKKGHIIGHLHFRYKGDLSFAVEAVKAYLSRHHLKHIHTVPFLINLDETEPNLELYGG